MEDEKNEACSWCEIQNKRERRLKDFEVVRTCA